MIQDYLDCLKVPVYIIVIVCIRLYINKRLNSICAWVPLCSCTEILSSDNIGIYRHTSPVNFWENLLVILCLHFMYTETCAYLCVTMMKQNNIWIENQDAIITWFTDLGS